MMKNKSFFYASLLLYATLLALTALTVYYFDPNQQFRFSNNRPKPPVPEPTLNEVMILNAGLIKNYPFETAIIGTSSSRQISRKDVSDILDQDAVNLVLSGSSSAEQLPIFKLLSRYKKSTHVIYGIDYLSYYQPADRIRDLIEPYAFTDDTISYYKYFFSYARLRSIIRIARKGGHEDWLNQHNFAGIYEQTGREIMLKSQATWKQKSPPQLHIMQGNYDTFLAYVKENPDIKFTIYFPPYSIIWWLLADRYGYTETYLDFKRYVITESEGYKNIELFDFQSCREIVLNLDLYHDFFHYSSQVGKIILTKFKNKEERIGLDNIQKADEIRTLILENKPLYRDLVDEVENRAMRWLPNAKPRAGYYK